MKLSVTILMFSVAALLATGMVMLYSSSMDQVGTRYLVMQLTWCTLGLIGCALATWFDYRHLKKIWWLLLLIAVVMLILVLVPGLGSVRGRARRWFDFGVLSFQPSEFSKLALVIALARYGEHHRRQMGSWKRGLLFPCLAIGLVTGLIFKEPDVGNALVLGAVGGCVLLLAGVRLKYFLPPVLIALIGVSVFIYHNPMRSERIYSWLHVEETRLDKGFQAYQAMLALGSGGVSGRGLGDSLHKLGFVREHHTDFIFSIIGEELGLIATLLIVAAYVAILLCGACISIRACDLFGFLLGSGLTFLISLQAFINIGVVTSALPNKGIPLPFISYGGSNMLLMLCCVGLLLSIARRARTSDSLIREREDHEETGNPFARRRVANQGAGA